mgnify:CR=1 FL=1
MRISEVHAAMKECGTLQENDRNKGVMREWQNLKRADALSRDSKTNHNRTKAHRLGRCGFEHTPRGKRGRK